MYVFDTSTLAVYLVHDYPMRGRIHSPFWNTRFHLRSLSLDVHVDSFCLGLSFIFPILDFDYGFFLTLRYLNIMISCRIFVRHFLSLLRRFFPYKIRQKIVLFSVRLFHYFSLYLRTSTSFPALPCEVLNAELVDTGGIFTSLYIVYPVSEDEWS